MACPRCDGPLERYTLGDAESVVCEGCGYIGVPVEHDSDPEEIESWEAALERFESPAAAAEAVRAAGLDVPVPDDAETGDAFAGVACPTCGELFDSERGMETHRGLVHGD